MPFSFFKNTAKQYPSDAFKVSITNRSAHEVKFDQDSVYLGNRLLTAEEQKKLLDDYAPAYRIMRRRNYGWRFLSFCNHYFNGQLEEIRTLQTDAQKLRYLLHHAQTTPHSKTAEALKTVLPIFSDTLQPTVQNTTRAQKKVALVVPPEKSQDPVQPSQKPLQTDYPASHMRGVEAAFHMLWSYPVIAKAASVNLDGRNWKYDLFFYTDIKAAIKKTMPRAYFTSYDAQITKETAECEWAKKLYDALDHFRCRVFRAKGMVSEIHAAFNEFIKVAHTDPAALYSAKLANGDFHELVKSQRTQLIAIHQHWLTSMDHARSAPTCTSLGN